MSQDEASRLLHAATGTRDEVLITLALRTGMRQGELAALRWEDLDLGTKPHITVRRSADTRTSTVVSTTKTGKERCVGIGPRTVETLEAHRSRQLLERMAARSWYDSGLVLPNTKGKIRRRDSVVHSLKALLEEAGLPKDVRFRDLRHTARAFRSTPFRGCSGTPTRRDDPPALCSRPRRHERRRWPGDGRLVLTPRLAPTDPNTTLRRATQSRNTSPRNLRKIGRPPTWSYS